VVGSIIGVGVKGEMVGVIIDNVAVAVGTDVLVATSVGVEVGVKLGVAV
jgi:hypothetical protein